jgi:hypothetical protein
MRIVLLLTALLVGIAGAADTQRTEATGLRFLVQSAWARVPAASEMRAAQFRIPKTGSDTDDGELVLFHFGGGQGGGTQDNIDRWLSQMTQADGSPSKDKATTLIRTINGLKVTTVDVSGAYSGMSDKTPRAGWRMLAAVIEGKGGPWFWKAVGPAATIEAAKTGFETLVSSVEAHN